jgi:hypothetical protein
VTAHTNQFFQIQLTPQKDLLVLSPSFLIVCKSHTTHLELCSSTKPHWNTAISITKHWTPREHNNDIHCLGFKSSIFPSLVLQLTNYGSSLLMCSFLLTYIQYGWGYRVSLERGAGSREKESGEQGKRERGAGIVVRNPEIDKFHQK